MPSPRSLFLATPCHNHHVHKNYHASVLQLATCGRYNLATTAMGGGGVSIARNKIADIYLETKTDRIFWPDSDVSFTPADVDALWDRDLPIVGAFYAHKDAKELRWSARGAGKDPDPETGLIELQAIGMGGIMIKREVFETMARKLPELAYKEDWTDGKGKVKHAFFSEAVVHDPANGFTEPTLLSEDWMFAYHARRCGYTVWGDTKVQFGHWEGGTCFPVQTGEAS